MSVNPHPAVACRNAPPFDVVLLARLEEGSVRNPNTGCLEWRRLRSDGYGLMSYRSKVRKVHRLCWEAHFGPIPSGLFVCHACDNPSCLAIEHLFLGTAKQNVADMHRKGRARRGTTVLNEPLVAEMKRRFCLGQTVREVATAFGLSYATVYEVKIDHTWKRIPPSAGELSRAMLLRHRRDTLEARTLSVLEEKDSDRCASCSPPRRNRSGLLGFLRRLHFRSQR